MIDEKWIDEFSEKHCYNKQKCGNNNPTLVILGESHGHWKTLPEECAEQKELIEKLEPEYALIETLYAVTYDPERDCTEFREDVTEANEQDFKHFNDFKRDLKDFKKDLKSFEKNPFDCYLQISKNKNKVKLVGCDMSWKQIDRAIELNIPPIEINVDGADERLYGSREKKMGEIMISYSKKTSKPLVAIIGHCHANKCSKIHDVLKGKVDYIAIYDC